MNTDLTIGYLAADGSFAVLDDTELIARCGTQAKAERVRAALASHGAAGELAALRGALQKQQDVEDHRTECLYCLHDDSCIIRARLAAGAGVARVDALAAASPTTADELARGGWALLSALTEGPAWAERAALEAILDRYRDATNPNATLQDAFAAAELEVIGAPAHDGRAGSDALEGE